MSLGKRLVADLMVEMGFHLLDQPTVQYLSSPVTAASPATISLIPSIATTFPAAPIPATDYLYPGAQVVVGWQQDDAEVATVISVLSDNSFTANLANNHSAGETIFGATFTTQQPTDPIFTQSEIVGYIAQAQNEFLTKVPLILQLTPSLLLTVGQTYQTLPALTLELERVAIQSNPSSTAFSIASVSRSGGTVTAILSSSANLDQWTAQLPIQVFGVADSSYNSVSNSLFTLATVSADGMTLTWPQSGANSTSSGGQVSRPVLTRLYESSQEQLSLNQPFYQAQQGTPPTNWFEDRAGTYGWGVAPPPAGNFYVELLASQSAQENLNLLSGFAVPDIFVYIIKYKALEYCFSKDGVERSPSLARYCKGRFDFGVMLADRYLRNMVEKSGRTSGGSF